MSIFRKLDPRLFESNRKEVIISLVNSVGFIVFFLFGTNAIVAHHNENKDGPHDNSQLSFVVCASAVAMQTAFLFIKTLWNLESIVCLGALASLSFETIGFYILSHVINFDKEYEIHFALVQVLLPTSVFVGSMELLVSEDRERSLNQVGKRHTDDKIKLLEYMEDEIKALTKQSKLMEAEKKKLEIDLAVKREREDAQKDNDVREKNFETLATVYLLQAEKLRKMEEEALRMKVEIRALKVLHEYDYSKWEKNVETIAMLTYKNERRKIEINKIEKNCVDLRKNLDDMRKNCISFQEVGKKAFGDAEQALGELIQSVLLPQQQR